MKKCLHCKADFEITTNEKDLYSKVDIAEPNICVTCRWKQHFAFWPFGKFRTGTSDLSGEKLITVLPNKARYPIYTSKEWWSDAWDPMEYGQDYDPSRSFFDQLKELQEKVPRPHQQGAQSVNCDWCDDTWESKNCYLSRSISKSENLLYAYRAINVKNSIDISHVFDLEQCYDCVYCFNSYELFFSRNSRDCMNSAFLFDCRNCSNCFMCWNLRGKSYCILNVQYTKEEYLEKIKEFNFSSNKNLEGLKSKYQEILRKEVTHRENFSVKTQDSIGSYMADCKNCHNVFFWESSENCTNCLRGLKSKDCIDLTGNWVMELSGNNSCCTNGYQLKYSIWCDGARYSEYCDECLEIEYCFGCVSLRKKKYCILNKQYTKEEYSQLVEKIKKHMEEMPYIDKMGRVYKYGEFLPAEFSPWAYNETIAQEYFPLTKEEAIAKGYRWRDPDVKDYKPTLLASDIPPDITNVDESITKEIIECAHKGECNQGCTKAFRIIPDELTFYKKIGVPLPTLCPACRTIERLKLRLGVELYDSTCMCNGTQSKDNVYKNQVAHPHGDVSCENKFKTGFKPENGDLVYCESCYQQEVD